jgi:nitroreductase
MKQAEPDHPIHELLARRWSPYGFSDRLVSAADLRSVLEAARWAPSSYNEQPWSYLLATRDDTEEFERVLSCLVEQNQAWARRAAVLMLTVVATRFARNGKPNAAAVHDIGLASANMTVEATARGLSVHQMIGILPERAREVFSIPEDHRALTAIAIGYAQPPDQLEEKWKERDLAPRTRKPLAEFVFAGRFGEPAAVVARA